MGGRPTEGRARKRTAEPESAGTSGEGEEGEGSEGEQAIPCIRNKRSKVLHRLDAQAEEIKTLCPYVKDPLAMTFEPLYVTREEAIEERRCEHCWNSSIHYPQWE